MRTTVRTAVVAAAAVVAALAAPAPAQAVAPPVRPVISALPAIVSNGGAGNDPHHRRLPPRARRSRCSRAPSGSAQPGRVGPDPRRRAAHGAHERPQHGHLLRHPRRRSNLSNSTGRQCGGAPLTVTGSRSVGRRGVGRPGGVAGLEGPTDQGLPAATSAPPLYRRPVRTGARQRPPSHARPDLRRCRSATPATPCAPRPTTPTPRLVRDLQHDPPDQLRRRLVALDGARRRRDRRRARDDRRRRPEQSAPVCTTSPGATGRGRPRARLRHEPDHPGSPLSPGHTYPLGLFTTVDGYYRPIRCSTAGRTRSTSLGHAAPARSRR